MSYRKSLVENLESLPTESKTSC